MPSSDPSLFPDPSFYEDWKEWAASVVEALNLRQARENPAVFGQDVLDGSLIDTKTVSASRDNLVQDGSFEDFGQTLGEPVSDPWFQVVELTGALTPFTVEAAITPRTGDRAAQILPTTGTFTRELFANGDPTNPFSHPVSVMGDKYYFEFYAASQGLVAVDLATLTPVIEFRRPDGTVAQTVTGTPTIPVHGGGFTRYTLVGEHTDAEASYVVFKILYTNNNQGGFRRIVIDDAYVRRQVGSSIIEDGAVIEEKIGDSAVDTIKIADFATSVFVDAQVGTDRTIFTGGADDGTWIRVFEDGSTGTDGGLDVPNLVQDKPVAIIAFAFAQVNKIRDDSNSDHQAPLSMGPELYMRVVRWLTSDSPAESAITADPPGTDVDLVFQPDTPISMSVTGFMPAVQVSIHDLPPADGDYTYDVQVKWEKRILSTANGDGTVDVDASPQAAVTVATGAPLWRSWVDPANVYELGTTTVVGILDYDIIIDPDGSIAGNPGPHTFTILQVQDQVTIVANGALPGGAVAGEDYRIEDTNVGPEVDFNFRHIQALQIKK